MKQEARKEIISLFSNNVDQQAVDFKPFGELIFPYHKMGAIDSLNLFDLDELIIFSLFALCVSSLALRPSSTSLSIAFSLYYSVRLCFFVYHVGCITL